MSDDTTMTLSADVKERLEEDFRHPEHDKWDDTVESIMAALPTIEELEEGCVMCDQKPRHFDHHGRIGGVIDITTVDTDMLAGEEGERFDKDFITEVSWYCSKACASEAQEQVEHHLPSDPDVVYIGGETRRQVEIQDASFEMDGKKRYVTIHIPPTLFGTPEGREIPDMDTDIPGFEGEPVFIEHDNEIVQKGRLKGGFTTRSSVTFEVTYRFDDDTPSVEDAHPKTGDPKTTPFLKSSAEDDSDDESGESE